MGSQHDIPIGSWCFSSLVLPSDEDWDRIHADDRDAASERFPMGWQLLCGRYLGHKDGFDHLDFGWLDVRGRDAYIAPIPAPQFDRGQRLYAKPKEAIGVILDILWHQKRACVYYSIDFNGQRSGRWYFDDDLEPTSGEQGGANQPATAAESKAE